MNKITLLSCVLFLTILRTWAQEDFKPSGSPTAKVFSNFFYDFGNTKAAFQLQRAYLGYNYNLSEEFSTSVVFDVGSPEVQINDTVKANTSQDFTAYVKIASLTYKKGNLKVDAGMVGLMQIKLQEQYWTRRYIYKSLQDWCGMGTTADLGTILSYKFADFLSADLTIRNGEGYKKIESDNALRTGLGITFTPSIKGLVFRGFYDYIEKKEVQYTIAHFIGYQNEKMSFGGEFNIQLNSGDTKDKTLMGGSIYGGYNIIDKLEIFGRYDYLTSNTLEGATDNWNLGKDGNLIIGGLQFSPIKKVQIALDYQGFLPADKDKDITNMLFLNLQFSY
jgi:hypothetical protein